MELQSNTELVWETAEILYDGQNVFYLNKEDDDKHSDSSDDDDDVYGSRKNDLKSRKYNPIWNTYNNEKSEVCKTTYCVIYK